MNKLRKLFRNYCQRNRERDKLQEEICLGKYRIYMDPEELNNVELLENLEKI